MQNPETSILCIKLFVRRGSGLSLGVIFFSCCSFSSFTRKAEADHLCAVIGSLAYTGCYILRTRTDIGTGLVPSLGNIHLMDLPSCKGEKKEELEVAKTNLLESNQKAQMWCQMRIGIKTPSD